MLESKNQYIITLAPKLLNLAQHARQIFGPLGHWN